jgi:hypothetical protein
MADLTRDGWRWRAPVWGGDIQRVWHDISLGGPDCIGGEWYCWQEWLQLQQCNVAEQST